VASNQVEYSLLNRTCESELLPAAVSMGFGVLAWAPLGRGVLTGKYRTGTPADSRAASPHFADYVGAYLDEHGQRVVEAVARAADGLQWSPLEVALAWVCDRPGVTAAIVGARTAAQLRSSLTVEECRLPDEIRAALDDVSSLGG
jgi:aryl-alcohol dehydrogenase-like predicted oxidoreductase